MTDNKEPEKRNYKSTLNLPKTDFSMKADLPNKEPLMIEKWAKEDIYKKISEKRKNSGKKYILHDGPPYANGHIHVGHVLNKMLKDICIKYKTMQGFYAPYVPGWDCHGLPVEHQLFKELGINKYQIDQVEFRKKAYDYALRFVDIQKEEFKRLGIFGEWDNPYLTLTSDYEADIIESFAMLYEKGYIYKGLKPVNWCISCETALAEAEVEHADKNSHSIYVKFASLNEKEKDTFLIIWTTTPWTLPGNVAVAVHPELVYAHIDTGKEKWVLLEKLVEPLMKKFGIKGHKKLCTLSGKEVISKYPHVKHPFMDRKSKLVEALYVTDTEGTGCVHTAPGHGQDDFMTGKKYDLPVIVPVDHKGIFTSEAGELEGEHIIKANDKIISILEGNNALIITELLTHSYPHCWRCKKPIIFRATEQWFMNIDHLDLRERLLENINKNVNWVPASGAERISSMIKNRPDWCLSRQRYWGVPIPAFQCDKCFTTFTSPQIIHKVAELTRKSNADVWFTSPNEVFLGNDQSCEKCGNKTFTKEGDILDVWFDSGVSHKAVLEARENLQAPADLYLEGSDQHRGWFQSSLITSVGMKNEAPYKKVLTHGFVVDGAGKKMSKSLGNVIHPEKVMKKYGADILRLWVSSSDYENDIKLSDEILERLADGYRKIRNTFRFLHSNLYDFNLDVDCIDEKELCETDKWILAKLSNLVENTQMWYETSNFHRIYRAVYDFCVIDVSSIYLDVSKDVLYVSAAASHERRSSQTALFYILDVLARILAPILSFTSEEIWSYYSFKDKPESVHLALWPSLVYKTEAWKDESLLNNWEKLIELRDFVMKELEIKRDEGLIGSSLEAKVLFTSKDKHVLSFLETNIKLLPSLFKISQAETISYKDGMKLSETLSIAINVVTAEGDKCPRCWIYSKEIGADKNNVELCPRCSEAV
ncbi:MAG: isoleucine--tRNA ligase [Candidatus Omnitrophica bacterium]|nr:isoleucine--tRNA ligase [Candidatus Omnitrophota bacterium]